MQGLVFQGADLTVEKQVWNSVGIPSITQLPWALHSKFDSAACGLPQHQGLTSREPHSNSTVMVYFIHLSSLLKCKFTMASFLFVFVSPASDSL